MHYYSLCTIWDNIIVAGIVEYESTIITDQVVAAFTIDSDEHGNDWFKRWIGGTINKVTEVKK